jgi:hypothetical protein
LRKTGPAFLNESAALREWLSIAECSPQKYYLRRKAHEPRTRAASAPGRQPPVRRRDKGASPGAGRGHQPPNPAAQGPSWTPRTTLSPLATQLPPWTQGANGGQTCGPWPL